MKGMKEISLTTHNTEEWVRHLYTDMRINVYYRISFSNIKYRYQSDEVTEEEIERITKSMFIRKVYMSISTGDEDLSAYIITGESPNEVCIHIKYVQVGVDRIQDKLVICINREDSDEDEELNFFCSLVLIDEIYEDEEE